MALPGSPASRRSTPSRSTPNGFRRVNGFNSPFRDSLQASPSLQVLEDYGRVYASEQRSLKRSLDEQTSEQQAKHIRALDYGLKEHERVRESAERELEFIRLENEREQRRKAELETQRLEDARRRLEQQKQDEQRRHVEQEKARQDEQKRRGELKRQEEDAARKRAETQAQRDREDKASREKQEKEDSDRRAREEAESKERALQAEKERQRAAQGSVPGVQPAGAGSSAVSTATPSNVQAPETGNFPPGFVSTQADIEATHQKYMQLHQRLKQMRKKVLADVKALGQDQKNQLTEWRQAINRAVGMLRKHDDAETKRSNQDRLKAIAGYLDAAARTTSPTIDITQYIVENHQPPGAPKEGPAQLLYLLHYFSKSIVRQIIAEVSLDPKIGNAIGILAVTVFARPNYLFNGQSLIDILWAKYHKRCPVLFGISGNENTPQGRKRIGWERNGEDLTPDLYYLGIRGLGVGFANITLRSFAKSQNQNPAPNRIFWQAIARVLNTPSNQVQPTHFELLKAIVEHTSPRVIGIFGGAAIALIRQAVLTFPVKHESAAQNAMAKSKATALKSLPHILYHSYQLTL